MQIRGIATQAVYLHLIAGSRWARNTADSEILTVIPPIFKLHELSTFKRSDPADGSIIKQDSTVTYYLDVTYKRFAEVNTIPLTLQVYGTQNDTTLTPTVTATIMSIKGAPCTAAAGDTTMFQTVTAPRLLWKAVYDETARIHKII